MPPFLVLSVTPNLLNTVQEVIEDPLFSMADSYYKSREEMFDDSTKKSMRYIQKQKELGLDRFESYILKE